MTVLKKEAKALEGSSPRLHQERKRAESRDPARCLYKARPRWRESLRLRGLLLPIGQLLRLLLLLRLLSLGFERLQHVPPREPPPASPDVVIHPRHLAHRLHELVAW